MGLKELVLDRFSLKRETGRVRVIYKYAVNPKYLIFITTFSLFFPILSSLSILLLSSPIGEWEERRRLARQGWLETAPTWRLAVVDGGAAPNAFFFLLFFRLFSSIPSSGPISHLKVLIQQIPSPRSTKEERKFYTFILGLDLFLGSPFKLIRSSIPLVRFRTSGIRG